MEREPSSMRLPSVEDLEHTMQDRPEGIKTKIETLQPEDVIGEDEAPPSFVLPTANEIKQSHESRDEAA